LNNATPAITKATAQMIILRRLAGMKKSSARKMMAAAAAVTSQSTSLSLRVMPKTQKWGGKLTGAPAGGYGKAEA
jgi:hypothetical protein